MKKIEEMNDTELLREILASRRRQLTGVWIMAAAALVMAAAVLISCAAVVPRAMNTVRNADQLIADTNRTVLHAEASLEDVDTMITNVNGLVEENTEELNQTIEKFSKIDFDKLNGSIETLGEVIEPLSRLSSLFGGR